MTCQEKILSEEYGELIFDFTADYAKRLQQENVCFTPVDDRYNIFMYGSRKLSVIRAPCICTSIYPKYMV